MSSSPSPDLAPWVDGAAAVLGDALVGAYLVGSHALGCADEWSDVDVLAVVTSAPSGAALDGLRAMHGVLPDRIAHLEGSYAPLADLASPMSLGRKWWYVDNGSRTLELSDHDNNAHHRWTLREHGIALSGPPPAELVPPVSPDTLRAEAIGVVRERAEGIEAEPELLGNGWYQPYLVLTLCRALYTCREGAVIGKTAAGQWALDHVPAEHHPLIRAAIAARPHPWERVHRPADPALAAPTRAFAWDVVRLAAPP